MSKNQANRPESTRIDRFKKSFSAFQYRHNLHRPEPIKRWKATEPRVKNLFGAAAFAVPGFIAAIAGGTQFINNNDEVQACRNTPPISEAAIATCNSLQEQRSDSLLLGFGGAIEFGVVGMVGVFNDGRLAAKQAASKPSLRRSAISR